MIVTAEFADDVALASSLYRIGENGEWFDYDAENGVTITENATVYFKAVDLAGNESEIASYEVTNIDKVAPVITLIGDNTTPLQASTLMALTEEELDIFYSTDNQVWTKYEGQLEISSNAPYYFKATDVAGNVGTAEYVFENIDRIAPVKPTASANVTTTTNGEVLVSAVFSDDSVIREYSLDGEIWTSYTEAVMFTENGSVFFRGIDAAGNISEVETCIVSNIDKTAPEAPKASADVTVPTNGSVTVSAIFSDDSVTKEYSLDGQNWLTYTDAIKLSENGTVSFHGTDAAGNVSEITEFLVSNIDKTAPDKPLVSADFTTATNQNVTVTAVFSEDSVGKEYSFDKQTWLAYTEALILTANGTVFFRGTDEAGNISVETEYTVDYIDKEPPVIVLSGDNTTSLQASMLAATTESGLDIYVSTDNVYWTKYEGEISVTANGTFFFKTTDAAGNVGTANIVFGNIHAAENVPENLVGMPEKVSWESTGAKQYIVECSTDNFAHVIQMVTASLSADLLELPAGTYQWRVKAGNGEEWAVGETFVSEVESTGPKVVQSNEDGNDDLFFASTTGTWENIYYAQHVGSINDWTGTNEIVSASGKGRIQNLFFGSSDPNVLCLTDGENGDAIFVDDVYTDLPENVAEQTARLYKIQEIRAGAGDDIVDMTSQRFEYVGDGMTIRGGDGDDVIWANKGDNMLFGDAGNDRIVGASGNDVIAGGIGNDRMHGGGGADVFAFCDNWGSDEVKQLATGTVALWFISGSEANWNASTLTYTDGENSVKVSGVTADKVSLKFGDDGSAQFATLSSMGAFFDATSKRIFEEEGKGILASL